MNWPDVPLVKRRRGFGQQRTVGRGRNIN